MSIKSISKERFALRRFLAMFGFVLMGAMAYEHYEAPAVALAQSDVEKLSSRQLKKLAGWKTYEKLCADCHGKKGDGRGPLGKTMTPEPANYQNCDILNALSDEDIQTIILDGSAAIGKSNAMQGFKKKIKDPAQVGQLIEVVRAFGGCAHTE